MQMFGHPRKIVRDVLSRFLVSLTDAKILQRFMITVFSAKIASQNLFTRSVNPAVTESKSPVDSLYAFKFKSTTNHVKFDTRLRDFKLSTKPDTEWMKSKQNLNHLIKQAKIQTL